MTPKQIFWKIFEIKMQKKKKIWDPLGNFVLKAFTPWNLVKRLATRPLDVPPMCIYAKDTMLSKIELHLTIKLILNSREILTVYKVWY